MYFPLILTGFGQWEVGHSNILGINIPRKVKPGAGRMYINRGQMFVRFVDRQHMDAYVGFISGRSLRCDVTGKVRDVRCKQAERDLEISKGRGSDVMVSARFFEEVWVSYGEP